MAVSEPATRPSAGVTMAAGFSAGVATAGVRDESLSRPDVALLVSDRVAAAAGVFTRNRVKAAPVVVSQLHLRRGTARAVVVNSGNANAATGSRGLGDALRMAQAAGDSVDCAPHEVLVASTGVIGRPMPMDRIVPAISRAAADLGPGRGAEAARAIMTTDTRSKEAGAEFRAFGVSHHLGGMAKGSGMIHPDMATLLAFLTTDAQVPAPALQDLLVRVVGRTFNRISVDGDTSTNDSCLLLANGAAGCPPLTPGTAGWREFEEALDAVLGSLAEQVVADGEGATRVFEVRVSGAATPDDALLAARCVSSSPLVKTAIHGGDPNWGRVLAAVGRSGAELALDRCLLLMQGEELFTRGQVVPGAVERVAPRLLAERVVIEVNLGVGEAGASALGCDLSADYVRINADYST